MAQMNEERRLIIVHGEGGRPDDFCAKTIRTQAYFIASDRQCETELSLLNLMSSTCSANRSAKWCPV